MFTAMQLYVPMSTAMLRLLWLVQIGKGVFSLQWPLQLSRDERVELVLGVGGERVTLPARVRSCTPGGGAYQVELSLDPLPDATRAAIESVAVY
ncbi:MAG TPA: hypothetical protein VGL86_09445 [Polyangia bacterium]|jgi:hypothetical protein